MLSVDELPIQDIRGVYLGGEAGERLQRCILRNACMTAWADIGQLTIPTSQQLLAHLGDSAQAETYQLMVLALTYDAHVVHATGITSGGPATILVRYVSHLTLTDPIGGRSHLYALLSVTPITASTPHRCYLAAKLLKTDEGPMWVHATTGHHLNDEAAGVPALLDAHSNEHPAELPYIGDVLRRLITA